MMMIFARKAYKKNQLNNAKNGTRSRQIISYKYEQSKYSLVKYAIPSVNPR